MKKILFLILTLNITSAIFAQQGKDGTPSITTTTVVNIYTPLTANASIGATSVTVASATGFFAGDLIYIVQMQGANVKATVYQFGNPNDATPNDTSFGKITAYNGAGNNQFAEVNSVSGNVITLNCALTDSFGVNGKTQIIRVPRYVSLTLSGAGQITCAAWSGSTGGIAVVEVQGNTIINGTSVDVSAKGFRGGSVFNAQPNLGATNQGSNFGTSSGNNGAHKGESIAGDTNIYKQINYVNFYSNSPLTICKGNVANGGGGGNANNCGGGGGSNGGVVSQWNGMGNADNSTANNISSWSQELVAPGLNGSFRPTTSSGGGRGGYAFSGNNADPTTNGPNNNGVWAGDSRHNDGGWGGTPLDYTTGKLFLGGGGGGGDSNDGNGTAGGHGGGMFYLLSYGTVSGAGQILANGETAINTDWNTSFGKVGDDGAGGGGGGGTVIINSTGNISLTNTLAISAQGGVGGSFKRHGLSNNQVFGPGGGGGGGYVLTTNAVANTNVGGGANGIVVNGGGDNTKISLKFPPNGATLGGVGTTTTSTAPFYLTATNYTTCASSAVSLSVTVNGTTPSGLSVMWYTVATGGTSVYSGNPYAITAPATAGTYTYYAGTCPGTYRIPIILTVNSAGAPTLSISATNTSVCTGAPVTLTVSGAMSYTWGANAGSATTNTVSVSPAGNTTYTVTGVTTGACAGTATASININTTSPPTITITPTSYTLCSGATATLTASSSASSYTWSSNAGSVITSTVAVSPTSNTTYTVTGGSGTCISTQTVAINVTTTPTISISPTNTYICNGTSAVFTASAATSYSWSTGATTSTISVSPTSNTTYTAIGFNGTCKDTKTVFVKVDNGIKKADSTLTSASCGQANGDYVLNSITGGISPYQINFNGTGFTAVSAFSYSVNNIAGNIYPIVLKDSLGCTYTTSVTIGNTSGITKVDSTIQNANCVPANSGQITINLVVGGTAPYQININGGTFSPIATFPYTFNNLVAGTYTVLVKDGTNCPHTSFITVGSSTGVTSASVTPVSDTCNRHVGEIDVTQIIGGVPPYSIALNNSSYQTASTFTALAASTTDTIKIKDANGCIFVAPSVTVTNTGVATTPTITAIGTATVCQGNSITLTSSSATSYTWSTGANTQTISVSSGTTYSVTTTSANGCLANSNIINVTFNANPNAPVVNDTIINECSVQQIHFNHATGTSVIQNSAGQIQSLPFTPTVSGTYTAYDTANGCQSAVKNITVNITATPTVAPTTTTTLQYCIGTQASALTATTTVSGASLVWQDANHNTIITPPNPTPTTSNLGTTTYYVYQTVGTCSSPTAAIVVTVVSKPNPNFMANPATDISVGQAIAFTPIQTSTVSGTYTYAWDFGDATNPTAGSTSTTPSYTYNTAGFYCPKLIITNTQTGCYESTTICLDVLANITMVIPNIFSPNGDGINDVFSLKANGFTNLTCDIFDRWGLKLYTFNDASGYWDGAKAVDGTYFYVIQSTDVKGEDHKYNGFIQLIK
ncbi:MAG: gliding motility-associated C-terminal domain-containing protein [Bacteroidia bacterium]